MAHNLAIVVTNPFFVRSQQVFPGFCLFKIPISHASLDVKTCFNIVLLRLTQFYFFLSNTERIVDARRFVREKDSAMIAHNRFRTAMFTDGSMENRKIGSSVLA